MILSILRYLGLFVFVVLVQKFILNNIYISGTYAYLFQVQLIVLFLLLLPAEMSHVWMILVSFLAGYLYDAFFISYGTNAAVSTLIGFVRYYATRDVENVIGAREEDNQIWTSKKGNSWKYAYFITFIGIYHFLFLLIESHGKNFFTILIPSFVVSSICAFLLSLLFENILFKPAKN